MTVIAEGRDPRQVPVQECTASNVVAVKPKDNIEYAADLMSEKQVRRLPVVNDQGAIVGIVSLADIAQSPAQAAQIGETVYDISERARDASVPRGDEKD